MTRCEGTRERWHEAASARHHNRQRVPHVVFHRSGADNGAVCRRWTQSGWGAVLAQQTLSEMSHMRWAPSARKFTSTAGDRSTSRSSRLASTTSTSQLHIIDAPNPITPARTLCDGSARPCASCRCATRTSCPPHLHSWFRGG